MKYHTSLAVCLIVVILHQAYSPTKESALKAESIPDISKLKENFAGLEFVNTAIKTLPVDPNPDNKSRRVPGCNYSKVKPEFKENPRLISLSPSALELLDLNKEKVEKDPESVAYLVGNKMMPGSEPVAHCYCGHQFGSFSGQLGDGRAITLGDIKNFKGELWELQLKGSGQTPYSRFGDGKAVLRSSVREYLCSEAMSALGIPTTRAVSLIVTDNLAIRDPLETGNVIKEKSAVVLRLAPTFWRFGSFEIFKNGNAPSYWREQEMMPPMLDYVLDNYYPEISNLQKEKGLSRADCYLEMFYEIVRRTARVVVLWQAYGFCHGVLNTDNMSILGLTMDFGPFGWMDYFDKDHICNHSDDMGRYSYSNQPEIGRWNLLRLAEAMQSHLAIEKTKEFIEKEYDVLFKQYYYDKMKEKLGLYGVESRNDELLVDNLMDIMHANGADFTGTFRKLSKVRIPKNLNESEINRDLINEFTALSGDDEKKGFGSFFQNLYRENNQPEKKMDKNEINKRWKEWLTIYTARLSLETYALKEGDTNLNRSDITIKTKFNSFEELQENRIKKMNKTNPVYILRNYMAEEAIKKAEKEDFSGVNDILKLLWNPFEEQEGTEESLRYRYPPPKWEEEVLVTCSS